MSNWVAAAAVARRQYGLVHGDQLRELGWTTGAIKWAVADGRLERRGRFIFALPGSAPSWRQRACEVVLLGGPESRLSHASAAHLWGLDGFEQPPSRIDLTVPRGRETKRVADAVLHSSRTTTRCLRPGGLPVTPLAQTLIDLAGILDDEALEIALDSAHRRWRRVGAWIEDQAATRSTRGVPGLSRLVALVRERQGQVTDSPLEVRVWRRLRRAPGLKRPRLQYEVFDDAGYVMRVDFAWPDEKVVVHADSFQWHARRATFDTDIEQRNRLQAAGWESWVLTAATLDAPWLDDLRATLEERSPQLALFPGDAHHAAAS
jgi:very-short-patch-repair endonuclease